MKNNPHLIVLLFILFGCISSFQPLFAQEPTTQDCRGAIPVCDFVYVEEFTASGRGNYFEIPYGGGGCPYNHCMDGERNSRWYVFTVISSGNLSFQITPSVSSDDYDWAVFDLSNNHCEDIWSGANLIMSSCNAAGGTGYQGATGISSAAGGTSHCNNGGNTNKWNRDLPVYEGETYVLVVSDWTQTPGGYTLDFSASTASIYDDQDPFIDFIGNDLITECGTNELEISFNENVKCSSIHISDFKLEGPGGPYVIDSIYGETCNLGGDNEKEYTLYFSPPITQGGDFVLSINYLAFIKDACDNYATPDAYEFDIELDSPDADAGEDIDVYVGESTTLDGSADGGSGIYSYHWEPADLLDDPDIANPTTIGMATSTPFILDVRDIVSACEAKDTMWVNVVGAPLSVTVTSSETAICDGDRVDLSCFPDGGSGDFTFSWTSNPDYFNSTEQNPSDFPTANVTYIVEVSDGFTTLKDSVAVVVHAKPLADAGADTIINEGTIATLSGSATGGSGGYAYLWEPASELEQNDIPNPTTVPLYNQTIFYLFISDNNACQSDPDQVVVNPTGEGLSASPLAEPFEICVGEPTTVKAWASGGGEDYTYQWTSDPPGFTSNLPQFTDTPQVSTRYDLVVVDEFENEYEAYTNVTVNQLPVIELDPAGLNRDTIVVCVRDSVLLDAGFDDDPNGTEYFWLNSSLVSQTYNAVTNGNWIDVQEHTVRVTHGNATACQNTGGITIVFDFNECEISVPENQADLNTAIDIHPNPNQGDFTITLNHDMSDIRLEIIDTRGRKIYQQNFEGQFRKDYQEQIQPDISDKGIYFIHLYAGDLRVVKKMVVQ